MILSSTNKIEQTLLQSLPIVTRGIKIKSKKNQKRYFQCDIRFDMSKKPIKYIRLGLESTIWIPLFYYYLLDLCIICDMHFGYVHPILSSSTLGWAKKDLRLSYRDFRSLKAYVSQEILNLHSLRHSHSADICIHFYCLI